jgi:L-ribulose-5-phosphate 4-epimerase
MIGMDEHAAREALVDGGRRLLSEGLVARTWGNLSVRLADGRIAITPSGIRYDDLRPPMVVVIDPVTGRWAGELRPSGERKVHLAVYARRPAVRAIVHTHQMAASICAAARAELPTPAGTVPCAAYALPSTKKLTEATVGALGDGPAVLMANHGALTVGADLDEAFARITDLERAAARHVVDSRPREGSHMPGDPAEPWDPAWLSPVELRDGSTAWLSAAPFTVRFSMLRRDLPPVLDDLAQLIGRRVASTRWLPERAPRADALLVAGQGALVTGDDHEAVAMVVEKGARAWIGAQGLGGARPLPLHEVMLMRAVYRRSYAKQASAVH